MSLPPEIARELRLQYHQLLLWGIQIRQGLLEPRYARLVRDFALERIRHCQAILGGAGLLPNQGRREWATFQDAERALVGFFDWVGRSQMPEQWEPLQTELYGNEKLGELVMAQMEVLSNNPLPADYPAEALEVQARCLDLGYCGHSSGRRIDQNQIDGLKSKLAAALRRPLPELAPPLHTLQQVSRFRPRVGPLWILGSALFLLSLFGAGVRLAIHMHTDEVAAQIKQLLPAVGCP